jgi:hypothetical protein
MVRRIPNAALLKHSGSGFFSSLTWISLDDTSTLRRVDPLLAGDRIDPRHASGRLRAARCWSSPSGGLSAPSKAPRGRRSSAASPPAACGVWLSLDVMVRSSGRDVRRRFCSGLFRRGPFRPPSGLQKASSPLEPFLRSTRRSALRSTRSRHASQIPPHSLNANRCNLTNTHRQNSPSLPRPLGAAPSHLWRDPKRRSATMVHAKQGWCARRSFPDSIIALSYQ